jgi:hypothetical protein
MADTSTAYNTLVTTSIANGATWTTFTIVEKRSGLIEFTDTLGNTVRSKQKTLRKLVDTIKLKKLS